MADQTRDPGGADPGAAFKAAAERSVDEARRAFETAMDLAERTLAGMGSNHAELQTHVRDLTRETLDFASRSAEATFDLVAELARARTPAEALAIQKSFLEAQMERVGRQARILGDGAIKAAQDLTKPFER